MFDGCHVPRPLTIKRTRLWIRSDFDQLRRALKYDGVLAEFRNHRVSNGMLIWPQMYRPRVREGGHDLIRRERLFDAAPSLHRQVSVQNELWEQ
jgi:hypothetical protein